MRKLWCIFFIVAILVMDTYARTGRYRCMIRDEPSTTLTIGWEQITGNNPMVYYGTMDNGQDYNKYAHQAYPKRTVHAKGMHNHFARLTKLRPNTIYFFVIKDSEGVSKRFSFKTLPDEHESRLSIIGGGDSRNHKIARQNANKVVARCRPHFVLFAGDMTGGDSNREWQEWLDDWQLTIGEDGRMTAVVTARGNHERSDASIVDMFDVPHEMVYYGLTFARGLMRIYTLNSMQSSNSSQLAWLERDLKESQKIAWRMAQYHHPIRPHTRRKHEQEYMRIHWGKLFHLYGIQLALECDSHMSKITWPLRASNNSSEPGYDEGFVQDPTGTVFVGEGGWGAPLRDPDDGKSWTRAIGSFNQVKWFFVDLNKIEIRTIKTENASQVGQLWDDNRFYMPANIDLWKIDGADYITLYNQNPSRFVPKKPQILMEIAASSAQFLNNEVHLKWKSVYEVEKVKFKIQVSTNKIFWKTVGIVQGLGPSASKQQIYQYTDRTSKRGGKYYYRIAAIDRSGKEFVQEYMEVRTLGSESLETIKGSVHSGQLQVPLSIREPSKVIIELFDTKRNRVFVREFDAEAGYQNFPLNIRHLEAGHYLLEVSCNGELIKKSVKIDS
ncbi:purple acid phosphatase family protein [Aureispira anguillae]|uniref:Metallophosphoesterase family protein n=1 Tax=Aureispira anguillae TaxID=2864201 RepID=A0A915YKL6_9BACT|nr:metallophosphoesterase family protein [Aureispira anguillae]BDS14749.1 metallophosphoesterase family protein [Aureispira anguillae]